MPPRTGAGLFACLLAVSACNEWAPLAPEPEVYPLESALRICRDWAERGGERGPVFPGRSQRVDSTTYNRLLHECMRAHGWVLRRKQRDPDVSAPPDTGSSGSGQPADPRSGAARSRASRGA